MEKKILVVDDDRLVLKALDRVLQRYGYHCVCFDNGPSALEALETDSFHLAVLDVRMPGLGGMELLQRLRVREAEEGRPRMPIVVLTGHADGDVPRRILELGADAFIQKPFDLEDFLAAVENHLALPEQATGT